ncbi:MAG: nascent polypeptide-associated complex protein [Candidatus Diapherotrites archaeon]|nr:nascent polypeptide-associated complex protein [Candidatus Diapherotrites archaeon]
MFPGMGNINPKQIQAMMKQLGIKSNEINANKVVIELKEGGKIIIENPNVTCVEMKGTKTYNIYGNEKMINQENENANYEEDIKIIMQQTNASKEEAMKAYLDCGRDIAEAIIKLKEKYGK